MSTIAELQQRVNDGESAQSELDSIAAHIYNTYLAELKLRQAELKEF